MDLYHSERLMKQFGFEKGLDLLNVMTARQFGMISEKRVADFVRENVQFFAGKKGVLAQETK